MLGALLLAVPIALYGIPQESEDDVPRPFNGKSHCEEAYTVNGSGSPAWNCSLQVENNADKRKDAPANKHPARDILVVFSWLWRIEGKFLNDPIAIFTFVLSYFTVGLYRETAGLRGAADQQKADMAESLRISKQAADAATLSAKAAIGVELPRLELSEAKLNRITQEALPTLIHKGDISLTLVNHGRTTAYVLETYADWFIGNTQPDEPPVYGKAAQRLLSNIGDVIRAGAPYYVQCVGRITIDTGTAERIAAGADALWIFGFVGFRDFGGTTWRSKFCVRLVCSANITPQFITPNFNRAYYGHEEYKPTDIANR